MRTVISVMISLLLLAGQASTWFAQAVSLTIAAITANQTISGEAKGLMPRDLVDYKVIVYVHTDQWYIHPYAGQGEGKSWASIKSDGSWQIRTVQREFAADSVAAI